MFVVLLKFAERKDLARQFMAAHNAWIQRGFDEGVFLMTGSLQGGGGGAILAANQSMAQLQARIAADPFVAEGVVLPEVHEITPSRTDARLDFLLAPRA